MKRLAFLLPLALLLCLPQAVRAQVAPQLRLYYAPFATGSVSKSPLDPDGTHSGEGIDRATKGAIELILWRRIGIGGTRQVVGREFTVGGSTYEETSVQYSADLTLYVFENRPDAFNLFIGGGQGAVERYRFKIDGVRQDTTNPSLYRNMPLTRTFGGIEYTWQRIGMRLETSRIAASRTVEGEKASIEQSIVNLTFYIPIGGKGR